MNRSQDEEVRCSADGEPRTPQQQDYSVEPRDKEPPATTAGEDQRRWRLVCTGPGGDRFELPIDGPVVIGAGPACDLRLPSDRFIAPEQARLELTSSGLLLDDLGSQCGSFLRVRRRTVLGPGDELLLGATVVRVEQQSAAEGARPEPRGECGR